MFNKKILTAGIFVAVIVLGLSHSTLAIADDGCTAATKFSPTTGQPCSGGGMMTTGATVSSKAVASTDESAKLTSAVKDMISRMKANGQTVPAALKLVARDYKGIFTKTLSVGASDPQVKLLQQFLNMRGYTIAKSGTGSPDKETNYFGPATQKALAKFQAAHGIKPASGLWGPMTRASIEAMSE